MDATLVAFLVSMVASALVILVMASLKRPRVKRPIDSPPDKPVTIGL